ncbi:MAG: hypothetical protein QOC93_2030 [Actinomycetota bacterium]|jgi:GNAT superfamily N-acetyltransferase|nr:hypothetical protein [Actinomycetota bacterium]
MNHLIRPIEPRDVAAVVRLVYDLAEYERLAHECHLTAEQLSEALFGDRPALFGHVAADSDGDVAGFALWFLNFSTWDGVHGVYLEDLYVRPEHRGAGLGRALLGTLAQVCVERGYSRLQWSVLDWNEDALGFYKSLGAVPMDEWTVFRLAGEPLEQLGRTPAT